MSRPAISKCGSVVENKASIRPATAASRGDGLLCLGSLSAAEADECRSAGDGVRQCRIVSNDGLFQVQRKAAGVLVTIRERLELVQAPYDGGPFLYLSPTNMENHDFLLPRSTSEVCG